MNNVLRTAKGQRRIKRRQIPHEVGSFAVGEEVEVVSKRKAADFSSDQ
jgi:hypothetical protein